MDKIAKPSLVLTYLEAPTKEALTRLMFTNNIANGKMYDYQNPMKDGKKWIVWYYADVLQDIVVPKVRESNGG
jgi:hypothetical protein